ncbi:MAG: 2,5-diketo-D-gluconate reductase A [Betaproteobacteria bacterium ADurb.Bin341]|nr:MAG: 2,5-diketo-D-gluconate reductase A [Betaproteobacteria bacterium ADurb.Bin341]
MPDRSRLGLGTVQFGLDYGIANSEGQVGAEEVSAILDFAAKAGLKVLDTAAAYGSSELVLGEQLPAASSFRIVTKTIPVRRPNITGEDAQKVAETFQASLRRLRQPSIDTVLVHHADDLLVPGGEALYAQLMEWKQRGLIARVGVSVYDRPQIDRLLERYRFDVMQLPVSVYDQRLIANGTLAMLHDAGVEIHVRSVFLQGILLMQTHDLPAHFVAMAGHHECYLDRLQAANVSPLAAALGFVARLAEVGIVLVGVNSLRHLQECIAAFDQSAALDCAEFAIDDAQLIDPRCWPSRG